MDILIINHELIKQPQDPWELKDLVREECQKIEEYFTKKEISKIFEGNGLEGDIETTCVYGKMTGTCNSARVANFIESELDVLVNTSFNLDITEVTVRNRSYEQIMTPLEVFILSDYENDWVGDNLSEEYIKRIDFVLKLLK